MTVNNFGNSDVNASLTLDSITLVNALYQLKGADMNILSCTLVNFQLKFQGRNYSKELHIITEKLKKINYLRVNNSTLMGSGLKSTVSLDILKGIASFYKTSVSYVNQSIPAITIEDKSEVLFDECSFSNNTISKKKSTISINRSNVRMINLSFTGNFGFLGGVVFIKKSNVKIIGSIFQRNYAFQHGGALYTQNSSSINIQSSIFRNNRAHHHGGVIFSIYSNTLNVSNTIFTQNKAIYNSGGVISMSYNTTFHIFDSKFIMNTAGVEGGALVIDKNNFLYIDNSSFISNMAELNTGVLRAQNESEIVLKNCTFRNNTAVLASGVISADENITMKINGCIFDSNPSTGKGVLAGQVNVTIVIIDSIFINNSANLGAIVNIGLTTNLTVYSSKFSKNTAGLFYGHERGVLKFIDCNFTFHSLAANPLLYISNAELELLNSTFEKNSQVNTGGVVLSELYSKVNVTSCKFLGNKASRGGVFSATNSTIHVQQSTFVNNSAVDGGVANLEYSTAFFSQTYVTNTSALAHGGIISGFGSTNITVRDSNFSFSSAIYGGCFYLQSYSGLAAYNSRFENSYAGEGGAVFKYGPGSVSLDDCVLHNNNGTYGLAIFHYNSDYLRLSGGSCSYEPLRNPREFLSFDCLLDNKCTFYTYNYTMSNYQGTVNSKSDRNFLRKIKSYGMVWGQPKWKETPYASCK